jgi:outer membrane protein assembly factor BamB
MSMSHRHRLSRRAALLLPLAATGCSLFDRWFGEKKDPLPGKRVGILTARRGLEVDNPAGRTVALPPPQPVADSPQAGGTPAHVVGHVAVRDTLAEAWRAGIGKGGGYRRKITALPVLAGGHVFSMDSNAVVSAFDAKSGNQLWRVETAAEDEDSTNIGGGIAVDGGTLYAATGLTDVVAMDAATGKRRWRVTLPTAARAAPTIAEGHLYIPTLDDQLVALSAADGSKAWSYQAAEADTSVLGLPSPAYADGLLVAGFGAGDLVCLRAGGGAVSWTDSLASVRGRTSLVDLSAIHGMPVIFEGRVYATGLGGLLVSLDLRSGRRLWEREIASDQTAWLAGDWLFVLTTDQVLVAVNRQDGAIAWITQLPQWQDEEHQEDPIRWLGPALAGDRLIVAGSSSEALAVSPYTGKILGRQPLTGVASLPPVAADGTVFVVTDDGNLLALR